MHSPFNVFEIQIVQAGRGLAYLHSQTPPICHGNIKPENVLINDSDEATLSDFGLSRLLESFIPHTRLAASGEVLVGSSYMAPELWAEEKSTCEGDVYAFGGLILIVSPGIPSRRSWTNICPGHERQSAFRG